VGHDLPVPDRDEISFDLTDDERYVLRAGRVNSDSPWNRSPMCWSEDKTPVSSVERQDMLDLVADGVGRRPRLISSGCVSAA
jgi:hypothetical protein